MKKRMLSALALSFFSFQMLTVVADASSYAAIDSMQLLTRSKEGQALDAKLQKEAMAINEFYETGSKKLAKMQDDINAKAAVLSQEALQEKMQQLGYEKKMFERALGDKREALQALAQRERAFLHARQVESANKLCVENQWSAWLDKSAPGVHVVAKDMDKTELALARVNAEFEAASAKAAATAKTKKDAKAA